MIDFENVYVAVLAAGAMLTFWLGYEVQRQRSATDAGPLALIMLALTLWFLAYLAVWTVQSPGQQAFWQRITYTAVALIPPLFLAFVLDITGSRSWRRPSHILLLSILPAASFVVLWTSPQDLFFGRLTGHTIGGFTHYFGRGPLYLLWAALAYPLFIVGAAIMGRAYGTSSGVRRTQSSIILIGALIPLIVSVTDTLTPLRLPGAFDPVPLAFLFTGALFLYALRRKLLLDLIPLARNVLVERMNDGVIVFDDHERVVDANPSAARLAGVTSAEALGAQAETILGRFEGAIPALHAADSTTTVVSLASPAEQQYADLSVTPLLAESGPPLGRLVTLHDTTEAKRSEQRLRTANTRLEKQLREIRLLRDELREQAIRDPLTTLYNRRFLEERMQREIARAERSGTPIGFLMLDIDFFKKVNDTYSHAAGDSVLEMVSEVLLWAARAGDTVCRWGGEEFLTALIGCDAESAFTRAEEMRLRIAATPVRWDTRDIFVTVSVGVSSFPEDGTTLPALIAVADQALYLAKESGRNQSARASGRPDPVVARD